MFPTFGQFVSRKRRPDHKRAAGPQLEPLEGRLLCSTTPSDPSYASQWGLAAVNAAGAWDTTTGSYKVVVADIDTGIDYTHPDLYQNIWINQAEIPSAVRAALTDADSDGLISFADLNATANADAFGVNDLNKNGHIDADDLLAAYKADGTGGWEDKINGATWTGETAYVDDIIGWDFANNDNDPLDHDGHGTHTAGIIGAMGDNASGVSGVNWDVSLMSLKIFTDRGRTASDATIAAAIRYSTDAGARVSNNSWGGTGGRSGDTLYRAISYASTKGQLFVTAAGNDGVNSDTSRLRSFPASYDLANIIAVAATDSSGRLAYYSNYGKTSVDIAAPGTNVLSTLPGGKYGKMSGTSMSTPFVTGAIALLLAQDSSRSAADLNSLILKGADQSSSLLSTSVSGGVLNIANASAGKAGTTAQPVNASPPSGGRRPVFRWPFASGGSWRRRYSFADGAPIGGESESPFAAGGSSVSVKPLALASPFAIVRRPDGTEITDASLLS